MEHPIIFISNLLDGSITSGPKSLRQIIIPE
jgi:hypothetical protein